MEKIKELCKKLHLDWKFVKFLFVGVISTIFGYCAFAFFPFIGLHYVLANLFANIVGIMFNFKTTGGIVFKNSNNSLLLKFFGVYGLMYLVSISELRCCELLHFNNMYLNYALFIFPNAMISFTIMKKFVFNKKKTNQTI